MTILSRNYASEICSGVYPYLQMAQLSHGQFWRKRKKNTRIRTQLKLILNVITLKYNSEYLIIQKITNNFRLLFSIIVWTLGIPSTSLNSHRFSLSLTAKNLTASSGRYCYSLRCILGNCTCTRVQSWSICTFTWTHSSCWNFCKFVLFDWQPSVTLHMVIFFYSFFWS